MAFMAAAIPSILGNIAAGLVVSALTKKAAPQQPIQSAAVMEEPAPPPEVEKPTEMPTPDDAQRRAVQRKSLAQQMQRRGRASTILSDNADAKLGG